MSIRVLLFAVFVLSTAAPRLSAQELSSADTLSIVVTSLETHLEQRWLWTDARVWLRNLDNPGAYHPSSRVIEALRELTPDLRPLPADINLCSCPHGSRSRLSGEACPTQSNWRTLTFGRLETVDDTTVHIGVGIGTCWAGIGRTLRLRRTPEGGWEFVEVVGIEVT